MEQQGSLDRETVKAMIAAAFKVGWFNGGSRGVTLHTDTNDMATLMVEALNEACADRSVFPTPPASAPTEQALGHS